MISAQNHPLLLSGNRYLWVLLVFLFVLPSCGTTKKGKSQGRPHGRISTKKHHTKKTKKIVWTEGHDDRKPPIKDTSTTSSGTKGNDGKPTEINADINKEDVYDVVYFIPFDARGKKSERFVQYYAGMQIAKRILEKEGVNLNVTVIDEKSGSFEDILSENIDSEVDAIVGPYDRSNLRIAAKTAKEKRLPLISPWQSSPKITKDNPYYIQLRPGLNEHYLTIFKDIKQSYDADQVTIIGRSTNTSDLKRIKRLQKMAAYVWDEKEKKPLNEYTMLQDSIDFGVTAFDSLMFDQDEVVVVIPNWSFEDESFIYGALRRLSAEKGMSKVIVYGMPIMLESDKINFDYYNSLNMRVARSKFVDKRDNDVNRFRRDFLEEFGTLPTDNAYEGYDNLMYLGRNITKYGKNFQFYLFNDTGYYMQAAYNVRPRYKSSKSDHREIKYFENSNVDIIEFKNNRFSRKLK